ncbi:hypothetical protein Tco_1036374 [Tanacetum coccineum]
MKATMAWRCLEPNQPDDVPVIPKPVLVDEDEDPEEEEEEPQEEEDMEVDIEEDENESELTYPYEEGDPLNPSPPASDSKPEDVIEDSDGLLPGLMRRDINSLFGRMAFLSRRLCGRETVHALVEKKGKVKDEYYSKLILDLGAVELRRWFEKTESVFGISECAEGKKVKFVAATLQGPALTWWNSKRFNELALMCPRMVEPESVKVDAYIQGLSGEVTCSNS